MMLNKVSLNTIGLNRIGLNRIGKPSRASSDRPYIDPEVLASLKAVCICYGKSNDDPDRAIVKNLVDPDNPFVISNAAYEGMSGHNGYPVVFGANKTWEILSSVYSYTSDVTSTTIHITRVKNAGTGLLFSYVKKDGALTNIREIPAFRVTVKGLEGNSKLGYRYLATEDATGETLVYLGNGTHELSKSFTPTEALLDLTRNAWVGIFITPMVEGEVVFDCDITIEILPEYEGAFVTDGIDDLITSTKTVQEMLGGSNEITVVSMMANLDSRQILCNSNFSNTNGYNVRNTLEPNGVISMLGYTDKNGTTNNLNLIMGDKDSIKLVDKVNFNSDYVFYPAQYYKSYYQVAWYWTIIANKVLTTDQINQVIAYFNLDRTLKPDILCGVKKQGITNDNHAEFGDKLIDFSGNGRDIQLNNIAWKGNSGIGKYSADFESFDWAVNISQKQHNKATISLNGRLCNHTAIEVDEMKVNIIGNVTELIYWYIANPDDTTRSEIRLTSGINTLPKSYAKDDGQTYNIGFAYISGDSEITIEQIPSHAGALCLDGVNDFGKVIGMPIYKDYTVVTDREIFANTGAISSKNNPGAFVETAGNSVYSFGQATSGLNFISTRSISYLSKYSYCGQSITAGAAEDGTDMWLGTIRDNDNRFFNGAIYSLMSFPYSMSEFLIERQLKKHKLGTLYPDMVEFRPIVKSNLPYSSISYSVNPGEYISVDSMVTITVTLPNTSDKLMEVSCNAISDISISGDNGVYEITGKVGKSPQKINMIISSYLTMLNNETLISNET